MIRDRIDGGSSLVDRDDALGDPLTRFPSNQNLL
jgi:hypothetical protein